VGKYLGKTLGEPWPKYARRVRTSQSWPKLPAPEKPDWSFRKVPQNVEISGVLETFTGSGYTTVLASAEGAWPLLDALSADQMLQNSNIGGSHET
jgi:hypothetical protein